jgi:hypothetical protein
MTAQYHGTVSADSYGKVFECQYTSKSEALRELRREAKGIVRNSSEENLSASWELSRGNKVIATGQVPMKGLHRIWKNYPGNTWHDYGYMVVGGTRIC